VLNEFLTAFIALSPVMVDKEVVDLGPHLVWVTDLESSSSISKVLATAQEGYEGPALETPNLGMVNHPVYFAARLKNNTDQDHFVIDISYPLLDQIQIYIFREHTIEGPIQLGDSQPFSQRYRPHRTLNASLEFEKGEDIGILLKVRTNGSLQLPLRLYSERKFGDHAAQENLGFGLQYGFLIIMIIYNAFLSLSLREKSYLSYLLYLSFTLLFQMSISGTGFQYLLPNAPAIANTMILTTFSMAWIFCLLFVSQFLNLPQNHPIFWRYFRIIILLQMVHAVVSIFVPYNIAIKSTTLWGVVLPNLILVAGINSFRAGYRHARYFILAWITLIIAMITYGLKTLGLLPSVFLTDQAMAIGSALEVVLLSLALGDRYNTILKVSEESQRQKAEALAKLRSSLQTRFVIVSDLAHRMNNPLNYIQTNIKFLFKELNDLKQKLLAILDASENQSAEVALVRSQFQHRFHEIDRIISDVSLGVSKSSKSVSEIRSLSGVDGAHLETFSFTDLTAQVLNRLKEAKGLHELKRLRLQTTENTNAQLICNRYAIIISLEFLLTTLMNRIDGNIELYLEPKVNQDEFTKALILQFMAPSDLEIDDSTLGLCVDLLSPYNVEVFFKIKEQIPTLEISFPSHYPSARAIGEDAA
jgi:signal transduction histidine kinase